MSSTLIFFFGKDDCDFFDKVVVDKRLLDRLISMKWHLFGILEMSESTRSDL